MPCRLAGPTAASKTKLAIKLARLGAEIISPIHADIPLYGYRNRQPTPEERKLVPHHLIDVVNRSAVYRGRATTF